LIKNTKKFLLSLLIFFLALCFSIQAEEIKLDIVGKSIRPTIVALKRFTPEASPKIIKPNELETIIEKDLNISRYFESQKYSDILRLLDESDKKKGKIDFYEWKLAGTEVLVDGTYEYKDNIITIKIHVYDVGSAKEIFGKVYKGGDTEYQLIAHTISNDIVYYLTGNKGIALTKITFISTRDGHSEIYVMDFNGDNQRRLTSNKSLKATPCFGTNNTEIYFTSDLEYNFNLYGVRISGGNPWLILRFPGPNISPNYSSVSQKMALSLGKDGNIEVYTMERNGKNLTRLTYDKAIDQSPSWSPNGKEIVFTSDRTGTPQIYIMNADGFHQRRITFQGSFNDSPTWSPKGDLIAFVSRSAGIFDIYTTNTEGLDWKRLTINQRKNEDPCFSPDGQHIAFSSNRTGKYQIYIMDTDGRNQRQLTFDGENTSPNWSGFYE